MNPKYTPLHTYAYRKARAQVINTATHCALCGQPLDHTATPRTRWYPTADHIVPVSQGGTNDISNLRAVHHGCNASRGNQTTTGKGVRRPRKRIVAASREW